MVRKILRRKYISIFVIAIIVGIFLVVPSKEAIVWADDSSMYEIEGEAYKGDGVYWFKGGSDVTINAREGYTISTTSAGTYGNSITLSESDFNNNSKIIYYSQNSCYTK